MKYLKTIWTVIVMLIFGLEVGAFGMFAYLLKVLKMEPKLKQSYNDYIYRPRYARYKYSDDE